MKYNKNESPVKMAIRDALEIIAGLIMFGVLLFAFLWSVKACSSEVMAVAGRKAEAQSEEAPESHERAVLEAKRYTAGSTGVGRVAKALWVYTEGDGPAPEWYDPDEPMAVEWEAVATDINVPCKDIGCPDYNVESTLWGWEGHCMESWELNMFSRIVYLEFNGTEPECMNAGIDSILNLWASGYFGNTIGGLLSATAENGAFVYTTYGRVWSWDYDYIVLEEIKALCLERFIEGPRYNCHFFQLYGFPEWSRPCYVLDEVYFSTFKEGVR